MSTDTLVDQVLASSDAHNIVEQISSRLEEEDRKRRAFYEWLDEDKKAEFVAGEIVLHSPVKYGYLNAQGNLHYMLKGYLAIKKLGFVGYDKALIQLKRNDFEPDLCFFPIEVSKHFKDDQSIFPIPTFVIEILSSNESYDRVTKYNDYQANGISEYWIIDPKARIVEQYLLDEGNSYKIVLKAKSGEIQCRAIDGFNIPVEAIFSEEKSVIALQKLLAE